jgi:hypothetical protein
MGFQIYGGTPKSSISIGLSILNYPFWGTPHFWKPPYIYILYIYLINIETMNHWVDWIKKINKDTIEISRNHESPGFHQEIEWQKAWFHSRRLVELLPHDFWWQDAGDQATSVAMQWDTPHGPVWLWLDVWIRAISQYCIYIPSGYD